MMISRARLFFNERLHVPKVFMQNQIEHTEVLRRQKHKLPLSRNQKDGKSSQNGMASKKLAAMSGFDYYKQRLKLVEDVQADGINLYPHKFEVSHSLNRIASQFDHLSPSEEDNNAVTVSGRVFIKRDSSKKLKFLDIYEDGVKCQIVANFQHYLNSSEFESDLGIIQRGDIIGIEGNPYRTKAGELSIKARNIKMLAPCLHMLPSPHDKIKNVELLRRNRHLDLLTNECSRKRFIMRTKIIAFIRNYLTNLDFMEVETPILSPVPGGAAAKPFVTHHNALDLNLILRIAPELYLKTLIIGGFNKIFEIGKLFRNEGTDSLHNPEFTACEFYVTYSDYNDLQSLTEHLLSSLVFDLIKSYCVSYDLKTKNLDLNFEPPFQKYNFIDSIESVFNVTLPPADLLHTEDSKKHILDIFDKKDIYVNNSTPITKLLDKLFEIGVEPLCEQPTFVLDHPKIMSPLAKEHRNKKGLTERFELFVAGKEICNAYTELNDPIEQRLRFELEKRLITTVEEERYVADEEYCVALEHGMPPTAGWGIGIDRLVMILTNTSNIRDVILFPTMKPDKIGKYRIKNNTDTALGTS